VHLRTRYEIVPLAFVVDSLRGMGFLELSTVDIGPPLNHVKLDKRINSDGVYTDCVKISKMSSSFC